MFERCKYANECDAQCSGAIENSETCDSFQLHQELEQAVNQYNQVVAQNKDLQTEINGYKTIIEKVRQEVQEDATCESRECGCDSYEECIECLKNTILNIIDEVLNG